MANYNLPFWFLCYLQFNPKPTLLVIHDSLSPLHSDSCHPPTHPQKRRKPHSSFHIVSCSKLLYKRTAKYLHCLQLAATCSPLSIFTTQNNSLNFTRTNIFFPTLWICIWSSKCLVYCCHNWSCFGLKMKTLKPSLKLRKYHHYQKFNSTSLISKNRIISFDIIQGI